MLMFGQVMLFISMGLGYVLCVLAKKQTGMLKTVGYTLGIGILTLSLLYALVSSCFDMCGYGAGKMGRMHKMSKKDRVGCPTMNMQQGMKNPAPVMK